MIPKKTSDSTPECSEGSLAKPVVLMLRYHDNVLVHNPHCKPSLSFHLYDRVGGGAGGSPYSLFDPLNL